MNTVEIKKGFEKTEDIGEVVGYCSVCRYNLSLVGNRAYDVYVNGELWRETVCPECLPEILTEAEYIEFD